MSDQTFLALFYASLAAFIVWTMVRGLRTGVLHSEDYEYREGGISFEVMLLLRFVAAGFFAAGFCHAVGWISQDPWTFIFSGVPFLG